MPRAVNAVVGLQIVLFHHLAFLASSVAVDRGDFVDGVRKHKVRSERILKSTGEQNGKQYQRAVLESILRGEAPKVQHLGGTGETNDVMTAGRSAAGKSAGSWMGYLKKFLMRREQSGDDQKQPHHKWLYGIQTCANEAYVKQLKAQLSTWATDIPKQNLMVVGGPYDNAGYYKIDATEKCDEGPEGQNCKEATILYRAVSRARELNSDWFFMLIDDAYIVPTAVEEIFQQFDSSKPAVYAGVGCGQGWAYHKDSANGTVPTPKGWVDPLFSCDLVWQKGGICTGSGYVLSRAALDLLYKPGQSLQLFRDEYATGSAGRASDLTTSCMLRARGVDFHSLPPPMDREAGSSEDAMQMFRSNDPPSAIHLPFKDKHTIPTFMKAAWQLHQMSS